jgi:hypothetical protein
VGDAGTDMGSSWDGDALAGGRAALSELIGASQPAIAHRIKTLLTVVGQPGSQTVI